MRQRSTKYSDWEITLKGCTVQKYSFQNSVFFLTCYFSHPSDPLVFCSQRISIAEIRPNNKKYPVARNYKV